MAYQYRFDHTPWGTLRSWRETFAVIHDSLKLLRAEIDAWDKRAIQHGASAPYKKEITDLDSMIEHGERCLSAGNDPMVTIHMVSIGSVRYIKAALTLMMARKESEISEHIRAGWPGAVIAALQKSQEEVAQISQEFHVPPADILDEVTVGLGRVPSANAPNWDVFISHAQEDKESFVRPLAEKLAAQGLRIWFDELTLKVGDSLRRSIDLGLSRSRFGVVVLSPSFLAKEWPQRELDGLTARELDGNKVILPIWHNLDFEGVRRFSPVLADKLAVKSSVGVDRIVEELVQAMRA